VVGGQQAGPEEQGGFPRGGGEGEDRQEEEGDTVVTRKETRRTAGS
jgi:hypothetical protein